MGGYNLHLIKTNKFKTITIDVDFYRNIKKEEITERNLLKMVLLDSSNNYKTERDLIIESENLYDIKVSSSISRIGNFSNLSFQTKFLNEKYTEKDMNKESIIFFLDLIFNPYVKDNTFVSIDNQKNRLRQDILSIKDNKIRYSILKLMEKMKDKPYSYNTFGYLEDIDNITGKSLYEYYKKVLKEDKIDIFVLGDFQSNDIKEIFKEYFNDDISKIHKLKSEINELNFQIMHTQKNINLEKNNDTTIDELKKIFPDNLRRTFGVIRSCHDEIKDKTRYFEAEHPETKEKFFICNQWGQYTNDFVDYVNMNTAKLGIRIEKYK